MTATMRQSAFGDLPDHTPFPEATPVLDQSAVPESTTEEAKTNDYTKKPPESSEIALNEITHGQLPECSACGKVIKDRFVMKVIGKFWHQDCLVCSTCGCRLTTSLFDKHGSFLCKKDYLRKFGPANRCSGCSEVISASELVMRTCSQVYHIRCFNCSHCQRRLNPGDRYVVSDSRLVCESDYEEMLLSSKLSYYFSTLESARSPNDKQIN